MINNPFSVFGQVGWAKHCRHHSAHNGSCSVLGSAQCTAPSAWCPVHGTQCTVLGIVHTLDTAQFWARLSIRALRTVWQCAQMGTASLRGPSPSVHSEHKILHTKHCTLKTVQPFALHSTHNIQFTAHLSHCTDAQYTESLQTALKQHSTFYLCLCLPYNSTFTLRQDPT